MITSFDPVHDGVEGVEEVAGVILVRVVVRLRVQGRVVAGEPAGNRNTSDLDRADLYNKACVCVCLYARYRPPHRSSPWGKFGTEPPFHLQIATFNKVPLLLGSWGPYSRNSAFWGKFHETKIEGHL